MVERDPPSLVIDLPQLCSAASSSGQKWAHESEDLDVTLLSWKPGKSIEAHVNNEVDVVLIGVAGSGIVTIEDDQHLLHPGSLLLIAKGKRRAMQGGDEWWGYLSVHRRRRGLMPTVGGKAIF